MNFLVSLVVGGLLYFVTSWLPKLLSIGLMFLSAVGVRSERASEYLAGMWLTFHAIVMAVFYGAVYGFLEVKFGLQHTALSLVFFTVTVLYVNTVVCADAEGKSFMRKNIEIGIPVIFAAIFYSLMNTFITS